MWPFRDDLFYLQFLQDNPEEMQSLENDTFLNSLESMMFANRWTDTASSSKLWQWQTGAPSGRRVPNEHSGHAKKCVKLVEAAEVECELHAHSQDIESHIWRLKAIPHFSCVRFFPKTDTLRIRITF
jgi:hypothetical protein